MSHCPNNDDLAPYQIGVCGVPGGGSVHDPGSPRRGVCVLLHGLSEMPVQETMPLTPTDPAVLTGYIDYLPSYYLTLMNDLMADGWLVLYPSYPEDFGVFSEALTVYNDIANDSGNGARFYETTFLWIDHVLEWCSMTLPGAPVIAVGFSQGGYRALQFAVHGGIIGAVVHHPLTIWETLGPLFDTPTSFAGINCSGADLGPNYLNGVGIPVLCNYGTSDQAVGWTNPGGFATNYPTTPIPASNFDAMIGNARNAGRTNVYRCATANDHALTTSDVSSTSAYGTGDWTLGIMQFITAKIDPSAPKSH